MISEDEVRQEALEIYKEMAKALRRNTASISANTRIFEDLRFTKPIRRIMAEPLSNLVETHDGKRILKREAEGFKTIKNAADLTWKHIKEAQNEE